MNRLSILILVATLTLAGCGRPMASRPAPLSVSDWRALPVDKKYTAEALERLKEGDPKLQTPEGWEAFSRTTLAQERKKDFPRGRR